MSGLETAKKLRMKFSAQFVMYFVTGYERSSIGQEYLALVEGFLQKPIRMQSIKSIIDDL